MKALVFVDQGKVEVREIPQPYCGLGEALIRVEACGICGSEIESVQVLSKRRKPPLILGHEFSGVIEYINDKTDRLSVGERVIVNSVIPCGKCNPCLRGQPNLCKNRQVFGMNRPGALAHFVNSPLYVIYPVPESLDFVTASLTEPLSVGIHLLNLIPDYENPTVAVIGAGTIGLLLFQAARTLLNAKVLVADLADIRLKEAEKLGADVTSNPLKENLEAVCMEFSGADGVDICIDAVGTSLTRNQSIKVLRPGGSAGWLGLQENSVTLDSYPIILPERKIFGSYGAEKEDFLKSIDLLSSGKVKGGDWVEVFPIEESAEAFKKMMKGEGNFIKAVITPGKGEG